MAKAFPTDNPFLSSPYYAPVNTEADAGHLHITGEVPRELCGTLYRNGPNPQFAPRGPYHWFGGDGMIHAFHLENGNVSYKNRWVRTPKWVMENRGGRGPVGHLLQPALYRSARIRAQLDDRQHQHRLARRPPAGARGSARARSRSIPRP
jgi:carotenoid cleavage dioxygenase